MQMDIVDDRLGDHAPLRAILALVLTGVVVGGALDLYLDAPETWRSGHVLYELGLIVGATLSSLMLWRGWRRSRRTLDATRRAVVTHAAEREAWRASAEAALAGFAHAVDERFDRWDLTPAERDIAIRLLKGHSHKQIAFDIGRSERTVRQHAVAVYQKSGLSGRAALAAFFLDDLPLPSAAAQQSERAPR